MHVYHCLILSACVARTCPTKIKSSPVSNTFFIDELIYDLINRQLLYGNFSKTSEDFIFSPCSYLEHYRRFKLISYCLQYFGLLLIKNEIQ